MTNGYSSCCMNSSCLGSSSGCFCDVKCSLFGDCCEDVPMDCQQQGVIVVIIILCRQPTFIPLVFHMH